MKIFIVNEDGIPHAYVDRYLPKCEMIMYDGVGFTPVEISRDKYIVTDLYKNYQKEMEKEIANYGPVDQTG